MINIYLDAGQLFSFNLNGTYYFYTKNAQGDIIGILDSSGTRVLTYTYDTWGKEVSITVTHAATVGQKNPYRYRGYRYDFETGLYYLQSRYYSPEWGRFINADAFDVITATPMGLTDKNILAYTDNNPVIRADHGGEFWVNIIAGATIGIVAQYAGDVIGNFKAGKTGAGLFNQHHH